MDEKNRFLVVMAVPSIKKYVFGTDRLMEIRGASALLDQLNRVSAMNYLENVSNIYNVECVFVGGGAGQFIVNASKKELVNGLKGLKGLFSTQTRKGLRLIYGVSELSGENYREALKRSFFEMEKNNDENPLDCWSQFHIGFVRECDSCSGMASQFKTYAEEQRFLCDVCYEKFEFGKEAKTGLWKEFSAYLQDRRSMFCQKRLYGSCVC